MLAATHPLGVRGAASILEPSDPGRAHEVTSGFVDGVVNDVEERYHLPGLALGIVQDGKTVYVRTAGELVAGSGRAITADTLFKIASNTKAMTTALLARLVEAGKLRWDDPVRRYLPQLQMSEPWITREIQVRDLLIHDVGLREGAGDLMLWPEPNLFTRADIIASMAYLKPQRSFRSGYAYDNLMYVIAGEVAGAAARSSYEELIRREVFVPLQMTRCQVGAWRRDEVGDVAQPHRRLGDRNVVINADPAVVPTVVSAAAGGVRCSLNDMLKWLQAWLDPRAGVNPSADASPARGTGTSTGTSPVAGVPWLSAAQREALWSVQIPMPLTRHQREWDDSHFSGYGYGWRLSDVDGVYRVSHTGTLSGMYSAVTLLPQKKVGFVLMINGEAGAAREVLSEVITKHFTFPAQAAVSRYADALDDESKQRELDKQRQLDKGGAPDTSSRRRVIPGELQAWLGTYRDPWFGEVSLCAAGDQVSFNAAKSPRLAGHIMRAGEGLLVEWNDENSPSAPWLHFARPHRHGSRTLTMTKVDPDADFSDDFEDLSFTRVGACRTGRDH